MDLIFIDADHTHSSLAQDKARMPCFGDYLARNYACEVACVVGGPCKATKIVGEITTIEELPQFLTHRDPDVRHLAKQKLEELSHV